MSVAAWVAARRVRVVPLTCVLIASVALLGGCAGVPARGSVSDAHLNALYAQLDQASRDYDHALQLARSGDNAQSQHALDTSLDALKTSAAQCANTSGCDPQRFFSVFDRLLRLKDGSFVGSDDAGFDDTPEAAGIAGESASPVLGAVPQTQRSVTLLRGRKLSDLIAMNGPVKAALQEWLTALRPNLMQAYVNYQYLRDEMWPEYRKADLPEALLFGILARESGGKVHAVSRSGAAGPLQFMSATGLRFGLTTTPDGFDQRFDPQLSARANAAYLDEQLAQFNDNLELVLAAYNGGEGRVGRLAASEPNASFWDPQIYFALSPETRDYVPMVLAAAWLFLHPERYNLHFPEIDGAPGHVELARAASLDELAVCLGQADGMRDGWFRTLRNLNPQLDPSQSQPQGTRIDLPQKLEAAYQTQCAQGQWADLAMDLHSAVLPAPPPATVAAADPPPRKTPRHYTVRRGDTLSSVARRHGCDDVRKLARANHLRAPGYALRPGQTLTLKGCGRD